MILTKLMALICEELGTDRSEIDEETLLGDLVSDEFELEELSEAVCEAFDVQLETAPEMEWSISDFATAVSEAY